jgi:histidyl-tRNA synthetase
MIFEIYIPELDIAIGGGGRYDKLIEAFRGEPTPAVGVAHGLDRIALAKQMQSQIRKTVTTKSRGKKKRRVVVIPVNEAMKDKALQISELLRKAGVGTELEVMGRKMARALEDADRRKVDYTVLVGEREMKEGKVVIRNLAEREQKTVDIDNLAKILRSQK